MTRRSVSGWVLVGMLAVPAAADVERKLLPSDVPPELRSARVFIPVRATATALGAGVTWEPFGRRVTLSRGERLAQFQVGSRTVNIDGREHPIDAAPYLRQGRLMVPLRAAAEALGVPISYEAATHSALVGSDDPATIWVLPLESTRPGIVLHFPRSGATVTSPLRVHGQANVFEGNVVVELRDSRNRVLATGNGTGAMGMFGPFTVQLTYTRPSEGSGNGRLLAFSPSARGDGRRDFLVSVPVTIQ